MQDENFIIAGNSLELRISPHTFPPLIVQLAVFFLFNFNNLNKTEFKLFIAPVKTWRRIRLVKEKKSKNQKLVKEEPI